MNIKEVIKQNLLLECGIDLNVVNARKVKLERLKLPIDFITLRSEKKKPDFVNAGAHLPDMENYILMLLENKHNNFFEPADIPNIAI